MYTIFHVTYFNMFMVLIVTLDGRVGLYITFLFLYEHLNHIINLTDQIYLMS